MYRISNDLRVQKSADAICHALIDFAQQKDFDDITISELCKKYHISRTTFYRLFDNTYDILDYLSDKLAKEVLLHFPSDQLKENMLFAITELEKRKPIILLLAKCHRLDLFIKKGEIYIPQSKLAVQNNIDFELFNTLLSYLIFITMEMWVNNSENLSPEEIYIKIKDCFVQFSDWFQ